MDSLPWTGTAWPYLDSITDMHAVVAIEGGAENTDRLGLESQFCYLLAI